MPAVSLAAPARAQPPASPPSATVWHLAEDDALALGAWSTCSDPITEDTECLQTSVQVVTGRHGDSIVFESQRFVLRSDGSSDLLSFSALSGPVVPTIARDLGEASVTATLQGFRCEPVGDWEVDCTEEPATSFTGDWIATTPAETIRDRSTPQPGAGRQDPLYVSKTRYQIRDASATALIAGEPIPGNLVFAQIAGVNGRETMVCRGGPAMQEFCSFGP